MGMEQPQETKRNFCYKITNPSQTVSNYTMNCPIKFKLAYETGKFIKNMNILKAITYLKSVITRDNCIPMTRYNKKVGRTNQAKQHGFQKGKWPTKVCTYFINQLENLIQEAEKKGLTLEDMKIVHVMPSKAPLRYGRRHSAFGRVKPYNTSLCHMELVAMVEDKLSE